MLNEITSASIRDSCHARIAHKNPTLRPIFVDGFYLVHPLEQNKRCLGILPSVIVSLAQPISRVMDPSCFAVCGCVWRTRARTHDDIAALYEMRSTVRPSCACQVEYIRPHVRLCVRCFRRRSFVRGSEWLEVCRQARRVGHHRARACDCTHRHGKQTCCLIRLPRNCARLNASTCGNESALAVRGKLH